MFASNRKQNSIFNMHQNKSSNILRTVPAQLLYFGSSCKQLILDLKSNFWIQNLG